MQHVCVMCSSILNRVIAKPSVHKTKSKISYISLQTPHILWNVHCTIHVSTYPQNGDIVLFVDVLVVTPMIKSSCHIVNCSAKIVVCGASSYCEFVSILPIYGKVVKFALCVLLIQDVRNSLESVGKNYIYMYISVCVYINIYTYKYICTLICHTCSYFMQVKM